MQFIPAQGLTCNASISLSVYSLRSISRTFFQASSVYPPPVIAHKILYGISSMYSTKPRSQGKNQKKFSSSARQSEM